ncbi:MAG: HAD hydrolase-like protein [Candidatus Wallbacteria bacterium]|nr:HAD hydrolase-like protein [Candidatus Wallbacteria bacterium]
MSIKILCLDLDGTLYLDQRLYPGVLETLEALRKKYRIIFVTNTTSRLASEICSEINSLGIPAQPDELYTASRAAREFLCLRGDQSGILLAPPRILTDYTWFKQDPEGRSVLIADEGYGTTFEDLHRPFSILMRPGTSFYTLQKNRYFSKQGSLRLDMGPLTAALEYASNREATILGKPSRQLFELIAKNYSVELSEMAMVGDDLEFDVLLPKKLGLCGILVKTGKYLPEQALKTSALYSVRADHELERFSDLAGIL